MSVKTVRLSGQFAVHLYAGTLVFIGKWSFYFNS